MNEEFAQMLSQLLEDSDNIQDKDAATLATELELNDENKQMLEEAFACVDQISEGLDDLYEAKEQGMSRRAWVMKQLEEGLKDYSDEEKSQVISAIDGQLDETAVQIIEEEDV